MAHWAYRAPDVVPSDPKGLLVESMAFPDRQIILHEVSDWHGKQVGFFNTESTEDPQVNSLLADGSVQFFPFGPAYANASDGSDRDPHWFGYYYNNLGYSYSSANPHIAHDVPTGDSIARP